MRKLPAATTLIFLASYLSFFACLAEDIPRPSPVPTGIFFQRTSYSAYSGNEKIWELHADRIQGTQKRAKATQVHGRLYGKGKLRYMLESQVAYINLLTTDIFFPDGATFESPSGEKVKVRILLWKAKEKKFVGAKGVQVRHLNTWVRGDRMVLDQSYTAIRLLGHVKAQVIP